MQSMYETFSIQADSATEILLKIAEGLNVNIDEENNERCINIPDNYGSGHVRSMEFENGLSILEVDVLLKKNVEIIVEKENINPLILLFNTQKDLLHKVASFENKTEIKKFESLMFSNDMKDTNALLLNKDKSLSFLLILINRREFEVKVCDFLDSMPSQLETIFQDLNGVKLFNYKGLYTLETAEAIDLIKNNEKEGLTRAMLIESKVYEIIASFLEQFTDDLKEPRKRELLRRSTIAKVEEAAELIKNELDATMTVNQLAKKVGLNQNSLQSGFQRLFNCSVNEYIQSKRLAKAKYLIENSALNLTEIAYAVGINSRSYFSKLFKEKFQIGPKNYLSKVREDKSA